MTENICFKSIWILPLLFSITIAQDFNLVCPSGWTKSYEKCYIIVPTLRSWLEADNYCQKYGARLAKPSGYTINNIVSNLFTTANNPSTDYWIGYNVRGLTNTQRYVGSWSDGTPTTSEVGVWGDFQPDTPMGSCARVDRSHDNKWYMESCDRVLQSVCELTPCPDNTFRCTTSGRCVGTANICNGQNDCGDGSDERACLQLPWTEYFNATDCKYYMSGNGGQVTMPITGSTYPASSTCIWTIEAPVGERIQVQFTQFNTEEDIDVVEFWEGSPSLADSHCLARLSGSLPASYQVFISSNNFLTVRFISDASRQRSGFTFTWRTDFQCQIAKLSNKRYTTGQLGDVVTLTNNQDHTTCESQCASAITCTGFSYKKNDNTCFLLKQVALPVDDNCCDLYVKTCPQTTGYPVRDEIPSLGGTVTGTSYDQFIYSPLYPLQHPGNLETVWIIQSSGSNVVSVEVKDIQLCGSDTVVLKDGNNPVTPTLKTLTSSSKLGEVIMSTGNRMYVYMKLKEHLKCRGVLLAYREGCNFQIKSNAGTIFTPGFGVVNYPGVLQCFWSITSVNERQLRLQFNEYDVENAMDYLQAWLGDDDQGSPIHTGNGYSGSKPPPMVSTTGQLALKFTTSAVGNRAGFRATYTTGCSLLSDQSYTVTPSRTSIIDGDIVIVNCNTGYTFQAPYAGEAHVALTCQPDGEYDKTVPVCSQAFCGKVPAIENGYVQSSTGLFGGNQAVYVCNPGFTPPTGTSLTINCQGNSLWEAPPTCTASPCSGQPLSVPSGRRDIVKGDGTSHGSILSYSCDQNYELIGQSRIECKNGAWSGTTPRCQNIRCPPQFITNGTVIFSGVLNQGDDVTVNCNTGFQATGTNPYKCGQTPPTCQNVDECTAGTATCNQNCVDYSGGYYCTCNSGYTLSTNNPSICGDIDECAYNNGYCDHSCVNVAGSYNCSCNYGYDLYTFNGFQGLNLQAGEDGKSPWHSYHIGHSCVLKQCPMPSQTIGHGRSLTLQLTFTQGDSVQYLCDVGYVVSGSNSATTTVSCQGDGTWNPAIPTCTPATCFLDVVADSNTTPTGSINYNSAYTLQCDNTNSTGVTLRRFCAYKPDTKRYGTVGDNLNCPAVDCGATTAISGSNPFSNTCTVTGCSFIFSCSGSYQLAGTSGSGDTVIRCGVDGRWDYGDLRCISPLCTDPGTPPDATQVATSYEIGTEITYQCKRTGYAPSFSTPLRCQAVGNTVQWIPSTPPSCVDITKPTFLNCITSDLTVELYKAPNHAVPTATDQSGFVQSVTTVPANYRPTHVVPNSIVVTYTAKDGNNNDGTCSFNIQIKDQIPPTITCSTPSAYVITSQSSTIRIDPKDLVTAVENGAQVTANSGIFTLTYNDVGRVRMITLTAIDAALNTQSCSVQVYTTVQNKCQPWLINAENAQKICTAKSGNTGFDCTFTCNSGYYFSNSINTNSISTSCFTNNDWSTYPSACIARNPAYYRQSFVLRYGTGILGDSNGCTSNYQSQLQNQWNSMATNLQNMCRNSQPAYSISISSPVDTLVSRLGVEYSNGIVYATFTFDMTPANYVDTAYQSCANLISNAFVNKQSELAPILQLSASGSCPTVSSSSVTYDRVLKNYFVCTTNAGVQYVSAESKSVCFDCALGHYSSEKRQCLECTFGFYLATPNRDSCDACPSGTNSRKTGLTRQTDCYLTCPNGFTSTTGQAPCYQCAADSYSSNGQSCTTCPSGKKTIGVGKSTESDCKNPCPAGYYSYNGLETCTACPRNFYQANTGQRQCLECQGDRITQAEGKISPADCVSGFASICTGICQNGGTCQVLNHDYYCTCPPGYTGPTCETEINPCDSQPCFNGGQCTKTGVLTFTCTCTSIIGGKIGAAIGSGDRFSGNLCENDIDDCEFTSGFNPCNNGSCHDLVGGYTCLCPSYSGFTGSTTAAPLGYCTTPKNPCVDDPCVNGQCSSYGAIRRKCICNRGYTGEDCETNIDECSPNPCANGGTCIDNVNSFTCMCPSGYSGTYCHVRGQSNVCAGSCGSGQTCVDFYPESKPVCMCANGYNDNGGVCQLMNYCDGNSCLNGGTCFSSYGGYICKCALGYSGPSCQFIVDNCAAQPCVNNGVCTNGVNSYTCTCPLTGTGGSICLDNKDNCAPYPCVIANTIQCFDRINDYYCRCKAGFRGQNCSLGNTDCNSFPCLHGGTCSATSTGYQCACATGWYGNNCENMIDNCDPTSQCANAATCYNTVVGYQCVCPTGYRGDKCDVDYNLCTITSPCVGPNSTCSLSNGQPSCQCASGYQGDSCNQKTVTCSLTTCQNGGTCQESGGSVTCICAPGYNGQNCATNINECAGNPCPTASTCIDGINTYSCQCNDGKIGANCDKDLSYKFDMILEPGLQCGDTEGISMNTVFSLATTKLSVSVWVRFTSTTPKVILSLYALDAMTAIPEKILEIGSNGVSGSISGNTYNMPYGTGSSVVNIRNGIWHHVVVTWNALNEENPSNKIGRVFLYADNTLLERRENIGTSYTLPTYGYLVVGGTYDTSTKTVTTANGISGKVSRLVLAKEEFLYTSTISSLYTNVDYLPTSNLINMPIMYIIEKGASLIDYQSELSAGVCRTVTTCNLASDFPSVNCPGDISLVSAERVSYPVWTEASYGNTDSGRIFYNIRSGGELTWKTYAVSSVGYMADNNAAVCVFRFYNKRGSCPSVTPANPVGGTENCSPLSDGERCTISCNQIDHKPSQPGPYYYSCNKYGMFDMEDRLEPFSYPPCASAISRTVNVKLKIDYDLTTSCQAYIASLRSQMRTSFNGVNGQWQQNLCNGLNCQSVPVSVTCKSSTLAEVEVIFNTVKDPIINTQSQSRSPQDVVAIAVVDDKTITYSDAVPRQSTLELTLVPYCVEGQQIVGNFCVSCAPGSFYDSGTAKCTQCPIGQYQSLTGQLSCVSCPSGQTTYNTGTQSDTLCFESCTVGWHFSLSTGACVFCPFGFYQPSPGSFHCLGCDAGLTTAVPGSSLAGDCLDPALITTTADSLPDIGESGTGGGLTSAEIAAIVLGIFIFLLLLLLLLFCCCRDRLPCFGKGVVEPDDKTPFKHVNRYGETDVYFTSYKLNDIREKRGIRPPRSRPRVHRKPESKQYYDTKPIYDYSGEDTRSVHTDISLTVPVFLEKLDGSVSNRHTYISRNGTARSELISDHEHIGVERVKKLKKKKKRRSHRPVEYQENTTMDENIYDEIPTSTPRSMAPAVPHLPRSLKPLPKRLKTESEASFASYSGRSRTDPSSSGVYSNHDYSKPKKEHAINIDSDKEDLR
ncbi:uncharacterized protein LOC143079160 isoform X5 [Mytilus galloprovincialis]|uniref:uncharacterized protein LOC143079160 isoform X5 n=1 Tax=Mytilus galloprovincialis TaxID=29158 RepID=UPI003F7C46A5